MAVGIDRNRDIVGAEGNMMRNIIVVLEVVKKKQRDFLVVGRRRHHVRRGRLIRLRRFILLRDRDRRGIILMLTLIPILLIRRCGGRGV
jgi:hypothetical protein